MPGADGVGERDRAGAIGVEQARDAEVRVAPERQRVEEVVVHAAVDHVDAAQPGRRPHVDDVVVHEQVAAFDERHAHLAREERVLEVGRVADARRQDDEGRIGDVRRRERAQRRQQRLAVLRDRADLVAIEEPRHHPLGDLAVGEHVGHAARHAQVVLEHDEPAVLEPHEIAAGDRDVDVAVDPDAAHLAPEVPAAVEQVARHDAFGENPALVVDVLEEEVDGRQPLREARSERAPLGRGDDPGQQVEGEDPLRALFVAVDGEGDALGQEGLVGLDLPQRRARPPRRPGARRRAARTAAGRPAASNISS